MIILNTEKGTRRKFDEMDSLYFAYFTMSTAEKLVSIVKIGDKVMDFSSFMIYMMDNM